MKEELSKQNTNQGRDYWEKLSYKITDPSQVKNKRADTTDIEIEFLQKYCNSDATLLDLGCGSGLITNRLLPFVKNIIAVEKYPNYTKFVIEDPAMLVINADLRGFKIRDEYEIILCTGVGQCFPKDEMTGIYQNIFSMLKQDGIFISRMHCGIHEDVSFNGFSEELQTDYFADFRSVRNETKLLKDIGFNSIEVLDFLPDSLNVWDNTRHYYFLCKK